LESIQEIKAITKEEIVEYHFLAISKLVKFNDRQKLWGEDSGQTEIKVLNVDDEMHGKGSSLSVKNTFKYNVLFHSVLVEENSRSEFINDSNGYTESFHDHMETEVPYHNITSQKIKNSR